MKLEKIIVLMLLLSSAVSCTSNGHQNYNHIDKPPNIIFILADDFGRELLAAYGGLSYDTPVLDKMSDKGYVFTDTYATPMCAPSRMMFLTGNYNFRNYDNWDEMDTDIKTVADYMGEAGYTTGMAGKWHRGGWDLDPKGPKKAGFVEYSSFDYKLYHGNPYWGIDLWQNEKIIPLGKNESSSVHFNNFTIDFIKRNKEQPFFFYYAMNLVHRPFLPTPANTQIHQRELQEKLNLKRGELSYFEENVRYADFLVGRIIETLEVEGLMDNTILIFTSDNGTDNIAEAQGLYSEFEDRFSTSATKQAVKGGKYFPTELGVNVPFIIYAPGFIKTAEVIDIPIDFTDMMPTFIEIAGKSVAELESDGKSFAPLLMGNEFDGREWIYSYGNFENNSSKYKDPVNNSDGLYHVISNGKWKYYSDGRLYNIREDRLEQVEIPNGHSEESEAARLQLKNQLNHLRNSDLSIW